MKKTNLTTAVVAGLVGTAGLVNVSNAVNLNPDGVGQVLLYPYYTVNEGISTLISVVNTTNETKAVKVRFLESRNSQEVFDFNLYLSPFDVWTAAIVERDEADNAGGEIPANRLGPNGPAWIFTGDTSCTVPTFRTVGTFAGMQDVRLDNFFKNFQYMTGGNNPDVGGNSLARTRTGHIEMIEMGVVVLGKAAAAKHNALGVPASCQTLVAAWTEVQGGGTPGIWVQDRLDEITPPTGGLFGSASLVNPSDGTLMTYSPDALQGFRTAGLPLHRNPGNVLPTLREALNDDVASTASAVVFDAGTVIAMDFNTNRPDAVSAVLMHNEIYNEYATGGSAALSSEWVVTHPTKRLHIEQTATEAARRPFTQAFTANGACEPITFNFWDREERTPGDTPGEVLPICPSPEPPEGCNPQGTNPGVALCWEANVITFNQFARASTGQPSRILGARDYLNFETATSFNILGQPATADRFPNGWARINFDLPSTDILDPNFGINRHRLLSLPTAGGSRIMVEGLPVIGFWALNAENDTAGDEEKIARYAGLFKHVGDRDGQTVNVDGAGVITPIGTWS